MKIAIVGAFHGTHVGGSLARAAEALGYETLRFDTAGAWRGPRALTALRWRVDDRKPLRLARFSRSVVDSCRAERPDVLIATGAAALTADAVRDVRALGARCLNYSTDDPWNPAARAEWYLCALPAYDAVCTTRRANLEDFRRLGCRTVRYLPFAYDEVLFAPVTNSNTTASHDVLFVGGGDPDRVTFMSEFMRDGTAVALVGGNWDRYPATRQHALGLKGPDELRTLTAAAKVNLCLIRRANRDGHVMRSFEIAALGGCMLAEDTAEHREIFGPDAECVIYFRSAAEAAAHARALLVDTREQERLRAAVRARMVGGGHTYRDRLRSMLDAVALAGCSEPGLAKAPAS
ncbi:MAG TPA: glycosyltransferase [Caulobacteraceae bacterium]